MNWIDKLERKFGRYAISNLMYYIIIMQLIGFVIITLMPSVADIMTFEPLLILNGEVWRIFTFLAIPPTYSIIFAVFAFAFYYFIGTTLESYWGAFRFNLYYLTGVLGTILSSIILAVVTGMPSNTTPLYINMTLFLALATIIPNYEILFFFVLPIKIKYLAILDVVLLISYAIQSSNADRLALFVALINFIVFFGSKLLGRQKSYARKQTYKRKMNANLKLVHKCTVCGRTDLDDESLEFRYCSKCNGHHEYCSDHLFNHEHIKEDV